MRKTTGVVTAVLALSLATGCERKARTDKPNQYAKDGLQFQYPGNWRVTEDKQEAAVRYLFVETPGDAIAIVQVCPGADALGLEEFAQRFANSAKAKTPIGNISASKFGSRETLNGYEALSERFSIAVAGESVPHTRLYRRKEFGQAVCFIIAQVADEDRAKVIDGFEQVFASFRYESPATQSK